MDSGYFDADPPRGAEGAKPLVKLAVRAFGQLAVVAGIATLGMLGLASEADATASALATFAVIGLIYVVFPPLLYRAFLMRQLEHLAVNGARVRARVVLIQDDDAPRAAAYELVHTDDEGAEHVFVALRSSKPGAAVGEEFDVIFDATTPYVWVIRSEGEVELAGYAQYAGRGAFTMVLAVVTLASLVLGVTLLVVLLVSAWG
ncbi:MAG: hypothetical protein AAGI01_16250 [Myxococcota bacterium]